VTDDECVDNKRVANVYFEPGNVLMILGEDNLSHNDVCSRRRLCDNTGLCVVWRLSAVWSGTRLSKAPRWLAAWHHLEWLLVSPPIMKA